MTWPYLAPVAIALALLALAVALGETARIGALRRRVRRMEQRAVTPGAGRHTSSTPVVEPPAELTASDEVPLPVWPEVELVASTPAAEPPSSLPVRVVATAPSTSEPTSGQLAVVTAMRGVSLLGRQLELLDGLEQREESPESLATLFQVDNLTMRLRRNAESTLVLAGRESSRRARESLSVTDTVRTACAQIDGYERVSVEAEADLLLRADVVVPLAHLLAELLENATRFSDPDSAVLVQVDSAPDGVTVAITDAGIGLDPVGLAEAQAQLREATPWAGGTRIGLVVVSLLAQRLGVPVTIASQPGNTTVTVELAQRFASAMPVPEAPVSVPEPMPEPTPTVVPLPQREQRPAGGEDFVPEATGWFGADGPTLTGLDEAVAPQTVAPQAIAPQAIAPQAIAPQAIAPQAIAPQAVSPEAALSMTETVPTRTGAHALPFAEESAPEPQSIGAAPTPTLPDDGWLVPQPSLPGDAAAPSMRDEVLAELGRLSGYRPTRADAESAAPLERRTSGTVQAPVEANRGPVDRDAADIRRRFSAFQTSVGRGRAAQR